MMKVERPNPNLPTKFQRLYLSLASMKKGFVKDCRPVIGLDRCFLKGLYKGILLAAIGRDANNNMYPIAIAVVESETKDSWTWFLECLVSDLGHHERHTAPTVISDRQKVSYSTCIILHITYCYFFFLHINLPFFAHWINVGSCAKF
jgi:hypothetical protein